MLPSTFYLWKVNTTLQICWCTSRGNYVVDFDFYNFLLKRFLQLLQVKIIGRYMLLSLHRWLQSGTWKLDNSDVRFLNFMWRLRDGCSFCFIILKKLYLCPFPFFNVPKFFWHLYPCEDLKGTVRPDWICMRVVSLKSPLKAHQTL